MTKFPYIFLQKLCCLQTELGFHPVFKYYFNQLGTEMDLAPSGQDVRHMLLTIITVHNM